MKFLSDILAKAGLVVDGVVQLNNTATGQTPASGDNSTKLATTAFVKNQNYLTGNQTITLSGDATGSGTTSIAVTLANTGVTAGTYGNASSIPTITVDSKGRITSISTTAVSIVTTLAGLSDVQLSTLSDGQVLQYNASTGKWINASANIDPATTSTLGTIIVGAGLSVTVQGVLSVNGTGSARLVETFTATAGQTTFTVAQSYTVGLVDVYLNGTRLSSSTFTATNGTTIVLTDAAVAGDVIDIVKYTPLSGLAFSTDNVPEGTTNLYFTNARARAAISLTTTGTSGAATYDSATGVLNIPIYQGGVTSFNTRTGAITLLSADVTTALGYTPLSAEADTLNTVTGRGSITTNTITVGGITATGTTSTIYAGTGTRLRTEANNLVFERESSSGFMKIYINQTTLAATAKAYMGYNNATLNVVLSNEHTTGGLELRTQDIIRQQIFANGNIVIGASSPTDAGFKLDVNGTTRLGGGLTTIGKSSSATQSLLVIASRADNSAMVTFANETNTTTFLSVNGLTGLLSANAGIQVNSSLNLVAQSISVKTDTSSQSLANLTIAGGSQNFQNRAGGNLLLQGGAAAGAGDGVNGYISFSTTNLVAASGVTNSVSEVARFTVNKNMLIGTTTDVASSILTVTSTTKGFLPPRMTAAQREAISSPAVGLVVYQTDGTEGLWAYTSNGWRALAIVN